MLWEKLTNKQKQILLIVCFTILFLLTRLLYLGHDEINPDGVNWHWRSEQFVVGLKQGLWEKTYQHYHPGVTLMWIVGPSVELAKQLLPFGEIYTHENFLIFHIVAKSILMLVQLGLTYLVLFLLTRFFSFYKSLAITALFTFEPFFVGNSRLLHMDVLLTLFLFSGLLAFLWAWDTQNKKALKMLLSGFLLGLAFLTKSVAIGALLFSLLFSLSAVFLRKTREWKKFPTLSVLFFSFILFVFLFFPALWQKPALVLTDIFQEGERVGVRNGHGQIILGDYTLDAGPFFYPLVLAMKVSPAVWLGIALWLFTFVKNRNIRDDRLLLFLSIFYLGYIFVMILPAKKIDRYMIPVFPYFALLAVSGYEKLKKYWLIVLITLAFIVLPLFSLYPYYFLYISPVFGSLKNADRILAQKPFGIGIPDLKSYIFSRYGEYPKLGFYDIKPMQSIYMNSRICDIRVCGTSSYDLLVLGINEELPEKGKHSYKYDSSFYIKGLEYWRIYVKEN